MKALRSLILGAACFVLGTLAVSHAHAQADLTFSGGNGMPLIVTLETPVTFTIATASDDAPFFIFQDADPTNLFAGEEGTTTLTFLVDAGLAQDITSINSGVNASDVAASDLYVYGNIGSLAVGDTVTLSSGSFTTDANVASAPPVSGQFTTFVSDGSGTNITLAATAAPEPSTWALLGVGAVGAGIVGLRRR